MAGRVPCLIWLLAAEALAQQTPVPGQSVNFYSVEKEIALGGQLADEFRRKVQVINSPTALAYISGIGQRLVSATGGPPFPYTFTVVADDPTAMNEVAAFPGAYLFVPSSLILAVKDEDELAGMLAHAIAHVALRDGTRAATRAELANTASAPLIFMGGWTGYAIQQGESLAIPMGMRQMWRNLELEADRLASRTMAAAGWDPAALARYIERLQAPDATQNKAWPALPPRSERIEAIQRVIAELPQRSYRPHNGLDIVQKELRQYPSAGKAIPSQGR